MNKFYILVFIIIVGVFGSILYITQADSLKKATQITNTIPSLPPGAGTFTMISKPPRQQAPGQAANQQSQQNAAPTFGVEEGVKASYSAIIKTSKGDITVTLFGKDAPKTVKNFLNKIKSGFYKNLAFHRVEDWVIQGGDPKGNGTGGGLMQTEINNLPFTTGTLGVARGGDINVSNDSQFFITKSDTPWLTSQYTNFGIVTDGMDVVNSIQIGDNILGITLQ